MKRIISVIFMWMAGLTAYSQGFYLEPEVDTKGDEWSYPKTLLVKDSVTKNVITRIDVAALDPYRNLPLPVDNKLTKDYGIRVFSLSGKSMKDILLPATLKRYQLEQPGKVRPTIAHSHPFYSHCGDFVVISYNLFLGHHNLNLACEASAYVMKPDGKLLWELKNSDVYIGEAYVDPSLSYMCHGFGLADADTTLLKPGVRIIKRGTPLKFTEVPGNLFKADFVQSGLLLLYIEDENVSQGPGIRVNLIDLEKQRRYEKRYAEQEVNMIKSITKEGIQFSDGRTDLLGKDVRGEDLSWKNWNITGD